MMLCMRQAFFIIHAIGTTKHFTNTTGNTFRVSTTLAHGRILYRNPYAGAGRPWAAARRACPPEKDKMPGRRECLHSIRSGFWLSCCPGVLLRHPKQLQRHTTLMQPPTWFRKCGSRVLSTLARGLGPRRPQEGAGGFRFQQHFSAFCSRGVTQAASRILAASPGRKGRTQAARAAGRALPVETMKKAVPRA